MTETTHVESDWFAPGPKPVHWKTITVTCSYEPVVNKMLDLYFIPGGAFPTERRKSDPVYMAAYERDRQQYCVMRETLMFANPAMLDAVDRAIEEEMTYAHEESNWNK